MKNTSRSATLFLAGVFVFTGAACSSDDQGSDSTIADETVADDEFVSPIPTVPGGRRQALVDALDAIAPGLGEEPDDTISNARNVCDSILGGSTTVLDSTKTRFIGDGVESMTDEQSQQVVNLIEAEAWCAQ